MLHPLVIDLPVFTAASGRQWRTLKGNDADKRSERERRGRHSSDAERSPRRPGRPYIRQGRLVFRTEIPLSRTGIPWF